ncbi:hypothetical protein [uncultured Sphingopyxis sp.]|uniref:hypothetical protein n=1 Tax=uncultured Sphingopyxis sp. TaxID=310581 RepID=UPI0025CDB4A5|nr:hypothetical protein [uncultured Sphingopyxis sp.]
MINDRTTLPAILDPLTAAHRAISSPDQNISPPPRPARPAGHFAFKESPWPITA